MYSGWLLSERCSSLHVYKCTRGRDILACKMLSAFRKALKSNFLFYPVCMYECMSEGIPWREGRLTHCVRFYLRTALQNRGTSNLHQCCLCYQGDGLYRAIMSGMWIQQASCKVSYSVSNTSPRTVETKVEVVQLWRHAIIQGISLLFIFLPCCALTFSKGKYRVSYLLRYYYDCNYIMLNVFGWWGFSGKANTAICDSVICVLRTL